MLSADQEATSGENVPGNVPTLNILRSVQHSSLVMRIGGNVEGEYLWLQLHSGVLY